MASAISLTTKRLDKRLPRPPRVVIHLPEVWRRSGAGKAGHIKCENGEIVGEGISYGAEARAGAFTGWNQYDRRTLAA